MTNEVIAQMFRDMADMLDFLDEAWKPQAYRRGAQNIASWGKDVKEVYEKEGVKGLMTIPGVGRAMALKIEEFLSRGRMREFDELKKRLPKGILDVMRVSGLGPKKAAMLYDKLSISNVRQLKKAAKNHAIAKLAGFGALSEKNILKSLAMNQNSRLLMAGIRPLADSLVNTLHRIKSVKKVDVAGSMRRWQETVKDIDILCAGSGNITDAFCSLPLVERVIAKGKTKASVIIENIRVDLRVVPEESYGSALNYFTGSKEHNIALRKIAIRKGFKLNEYGLFSKKTNKLVGGRTEKEVYKKLGLSYIPPELREMQGELDNTLPDLVELKDVKGDLHMHTAFSDGKNSIEEMAQAAKTDYICITDHCGKISITNPVTKKRFKQYSDAIDYANKKVNVTILKGLEVDINKEGGVECPTSMLKELDFCLASIHRAFTMDVKAMTKRICKAMDNPYITAFAHPTGRLVLKRGGYSFDTAKVFAHAEKTNTALEINAHPSRTDLPASLIKEASAYKLLFCMGTDAHAVSHLDYLKYGIANARRGWLPKHKLLNTLTLSKFKRALS